jgi:hypothetical protein
MRRATRVGSQLLQVFATLLFAAICAQAARKIQTFAPLSTTRGGSVHADK